MKIKGQEYNGHPSKGHWNVALWINNDECTYSVAMTALKERGRKSAARWLIMHMLPARTPDGYQYTYARVYAALDQE